MKMILFVVSTLITVYSLMLINKTKKHFQIFPDNLKKEYYKSLKSMTLLSFTSVIFVVTSFICLASSNFFILSGVSIFLSLCSISSTMDQIEGLEGFGEEQIKSNINIKSILKRK